MRFQMGNLALVAGTTEFSCEELMDGDTGQRNGERADFVIRH